MIALQLTGSAMAYTSYYMDHQVSEKQARNSIREEYNRTRIGERKTRNCNRNSMLKQIGFSSRWQTELV